MPRIFLISRAGFDFDTACGVEGALDIQWMSVLAPDRSGAENRIPLS